MNSQKKNRPTNTRRQFLAWFGGTGITSLVFPTILWEKIQDENDQQVTVDMIIEASRLADLEFTREEQKAMVEGVNKSLTTIDEIHDFHIDNSIPLPLYFNPLVSGVILDTNEKPFRPTVPSGIGRPNDLEEVAFWPLTHLAKLIETRQVSAIELTKMYLNRLQQYNPILNCVVTLTTKRALKQAKLVDKDLAKGHYRGILHGIPWGAKDIISAQGYKTTWGAAPFQEQKFDYDATVVERLDQAGAVLIAKLTTGELAFGDKWFGGRTNNPWEPKQGSSGSSAGSAAATAAGLVAFAIGTDTGGSILHPSIRCGVVGLRPTFGRVSRFGVMAASFSLDKIGPMCRTAEDCAIVLYSIAGPDGKDLAVSNAIPFNWDAGIDVNSLKVGYFEKAFSEGSDKEENLNNELMLKTIKQSGIKPKPVSLPKNKLTYFIEFVERAAAFDEFARTRQDKGLNAYSDEKWDPKTALRVSHLVPAVEYLQANRIRMLLMEEVANVMNDFDVVIAPYRSINPLTSMTGHPVATLPTGFRTNGTPTGITLMGGLYKESELLLIGKTFQDDTDFHSRQPDLFE